MIQNTFYRLKNYTNYFICCLFLLFSCEANNQKTIDKPKNIDKENKVSAAKLDFEKRLRLSDSLNKFVVEPNEKKIKALGNYVFEDTKNLYQYQVNRVVLANLSPVNDVNAKLKVLANIKKRSKERKDSLEVVIRGNKVYLEYNTTERIINLDKNVVLIDLNNDKIEELLCWSGFLGDELGGSFLGLWAFDTKKQAYYLTYCFEGVDVIENFAIDSVTQKVDLQYFTYGCCADYSRKQTKYTITYQNDKFKIEEISSRVFNEKHYFFPKKLQTPKKVTLDYESFIYSKPLVRDSKVLAENSDAYIFNATGLTFFYTYCIGKIPSGTEVTILSTYTNSKKETWRFALLEKGYKPKELILFQLCDKNSQIYVWLPPKGYTNE